MTLTTQVCGRPGYNDTHGEGERQQVVIAAILKELEKKARQHGGGDEGEKDQSKLVGLPVKQLRQMSGSLQPSGSVAFMEARRARSASSAASRAACVPG
mmetsp:Transcript_25746/g.79207  ORF Transcript_25746/g.79207 Transcript_25746/m.79207 type:complete len:99 (-) Transcript_25746:819-1115(-)